MNNDDVLKSDITHDSIDHFFYPFCQHYASTLRNEATPLESWGSNLRILWFRMGRHGDGGISTHGCNEEKHHWLTSGSPKR